MRKISIPNKTAEETSVFTDGVIKKCDEFVRKYYKQGFVDGWNTCVEKLIDSKRKSAGKEGTIKQNPSEGK